MAHDSVTTDSRGQRSSTESTPYRRLAPVDALRRLKPGEGVLVYGHLLPAQLRLRPYYRDPELGRRAAHPDPANADGDEGLWEDDAVVVEEDSPAQTTTHLWGEVAQP